MANSAREETNKVLETTTAPIEPSAARAQAFASQLSTVLAACSDNQLGDDLTRFAISALRDTAMLR